MLANESDTAAFFLGKTTWKVMLVGAELRL